MLDRIGNCRIIGEIGSGGMADIYNAVQEPLERVVAIKALKPSIAVDSHVALRFEREARFMASLQHENILHVYDFLKDGDTMYMEPSCLRKSWTCRMFSCWSEAMKWASRSKRFANPESTAIDGFSALIATVRPSGS